MGHASLATGTVPAAHGMVGNVWFDCALGRLTYNIQDARYRLLTAGADVDQKAEIDPTQKAAKVDGRSPVAILSSTFSDELAVHYGGKSWELNHAASTYLFGDADDRAYETDFPGFGRTFPHPYGEVDDKYLTTRLTLSPAGDELTLDFAKTLLDNERLGQDEVPDYLAVSFSSTDYVGHIFGASSLEAEDNIARLDRTLADLLAHVDEKVGLANTLIVLSADHGQPEVPGYLDELGIHNAQYFETDALDKARPLPR